MKMSDKKHKQRRGNGFTLIELLVVISIIVMLIGVLIPGMRAFKRSADNLKQKSRFHSMEVGLEMYMKDFREYPDSKMQLAGTNAGVVNGAHHLAEALLGRDTRGFDYESTWYVPRDFGSDIYANENNNPDPQEIENSKNRRKGPYMDLKDVGAFRLNAGNAETWYAGNATEVATVSGSTMTSILAGTQEYAQPVISDIFYKKLITVTNLDTKKDETFRVGTPVLYFKANEAEKMSRAYDEDGEPSTPPTNYLHLIYNWEDNQAMFELPVHDEPLTLLHHYNEAYTAGTPVQNGIEIFYDDITNEKVSQYTRPVNARGYLLISAGRDGIYGTKDDVTNFGK